MYAGWVSPCLHFIRQCRPPLEIVREIQPLDALCAKNEMGLQEKTKQRNLEGLNWLSSIDIGGSTKNWGERERE